MSTLKNKVSIQVPGQQPDFVQSEDPDFLQFLKAYYEFLESAELKLKDLGSKDSILLEEGSTSLIIQESKNRYRTGEDNTILLEDTPYGAFVDGETITGQTSKATAVIRVQDINVASRLFISSQNNFILGEEIVGATSNASGYIDTYTANPVQNISQLLEYFDVDDTIDSFFTEFKEAFMRTIPKRLTTGLDERNLLKNIKDLYRAKGTRKGHELFFRILLNEDAVITYPTNNTLRVSSGKWSDDTILRVVATNDTLLMENSSASNGDIFPLMEDGSQILLQDSQAGTDRLVRLVGKTITQRAVIDLSILTGGAYENDGYSVINKATAVVDSAYQYQLSGQTVTEFILNPGSIDGTFFVGHNITGPDNTNADVTLTAKIISIVNNASIRATDFQSSQYFITTDPITVSADTGNDAVASIEKVTSGTISNIVVDAGGSGYSAGDQIVVDNSNTNGTDLAGEISLVNGGFAPETGTLSDEFRVTLEDGTPGAPGEILLEESFIDYELPTGVLHIGETITGQTSGATGTVVLLNLDIKQIVYNAGSGSFTLGERIVGGTSGYKVTILTNSVNNFVANEEDLEMVSTDRFTLEDETTLGDTFLGASIAQESGTGTGDITDIRVTTEGWGYTSLPTLTITSSGTGGSVKAKGTNVGTIQSIQIIDQGAHYTDQASLKFLTTTNFLCTLISGTFTVDETITGGTSGATGRFKKQVDAVGLVEMDQLSATPFIAGETITGGSSSQTAKINSFTKTNIPATIGTVVDRSGRYIGQTGFLDDPSQRVIDSYYYQDYSYVVKTASSIVDWRDELLAAVHPAGWALFGQVDIGGNAPALGYLANITSVSGLGPVYGMIWNALIGRRLGTSTQGPLNPAPMAEANEPEDKTNLYNPALKVNPGTAFTTYETITGGTSGATAIVVSDVTNEAGVRIVTYEQGYNQGIFQVAEVITGSSSGRTTTIAEVYGLRGKREVTLTQKLELRMQMGPKGNNAAGPPNLGDLNRFMFAQSMITSDTSTYTFRSHNVYVVGIPYSALSSGIDSSQTTIGVATITNYPTSGTIQIGSELIDYTGVSASNFTGCTRGAHSTTAAAHLSGAIVDAVRWAQKQNEVRPGYRIDDWLTDYQGTALTIGDITNYPNRKNDISPPIEVTIYKT